MNGDGVGMVDKCIRRGWGRKPFWGMGREWDWFSL